MKIRFRQDFSITRVVIDLIIALLGMIIVGLLISNRLYLASLCFFIGSIFFLVPLYYYIKTNKP